MDLIYTDIHVNGSFKTDYKIVFHLLTMKIQRKNGTTLLKLFKF